MLMRKLLPVILFLSFIINSSAQSTAEYCVQVTATVQENPAQITLHWPFDTTGVNSYSVARKALSAPFWTFYFSPLPQTAISFTDTMVTVDSAYEYRVYKNGIPSGYSYVYAGIKAPVIEYRGKLLLIVDSLLNDSLSFELHRLMKDISGDGWAVKRIDVDTADPDYFIKSLISSEYFADTANVKAVMLVGHIAVPYSGDINPDGHPDHLGAWPADVYYANMHLHFTDATVNDTLASRAQNRNAPGDGKWDPSAMYGSESELEVSRIDLSNMSAFNKSETQLLKSYLNKDHAYRMKHITTIARGLVDDNFGAFGGEAFAINGWRNFAPLLGDTNIFALDFITTLDTAAYQWSYGCGGGNYSGAGGIGSTSDFVNHNVKSIFTMLFGSYFGDWNVANNFLRAPLCAPEPALTSCWAGRPHWMFHHMALGENIGYSAHLTQNESGSLYGTNYGADFVHVALMGDLTLREHIIAPPIITTLSDTNETATIKWTSSTDNVLGYYVYRSETEFGIYTRVNPSTIADTTFTDANAGPGLKYYMVRALRLENTPSGTYYNLSEGIADTINVRDTVELSTGITLLASGKINFNLHPIPASDVLTVDLTFEKAQNFSIEIFNVIGEQISSETFNANASRTGIDVSGFAAGNYFCRIVSQEGVVSKRFVVVR